MVPGGEGGERERVAIGHDVRRCVAKMEEWRDEIAERWLKLQSERESTAKRQEQMRLCLDGLYGAAAALSPIAQALTQ